MADQHVDRCIRAAVGCVAHTVALEHGAGARVGVHMAKPGDIHLHTPPTQPHGVAVEYIIIGEIRKAMALCWAAIDTDKCKLLSRWYLIPHLTARICSCSYSDHARSVSLGLHSPLSELSHGSVADETSNDGHHCHYTYRASLAT